MDVLHYSFSLSACPKCHLLVCKHTSLANLDFRSCEEEEGEEEKQSIIQLKTSTNIKTRYQRLSSHGMNFYVLPKTTSPDNRHSWTTFGSGSIESSNTLENLSLDHELLSDNIPFADENIIQSSLSFQPTLNQLVRTQSECCEKKFTPPICLTKSYSFSTIYTTPTPSKSLTSSPHITIEKNSSQHIHSNLSILLLIVLIISYLLTNTLDIVLLYIYYHTNYLYLIIFTATILICDIILWINNLIDIKNLSTRLLLIPFLLRLYILYELVELIFVLSNKHSLDNVEIFDSTISTPSSSTTTTLETNITGTMDSSVNHHHHHRRRQSRHRTQSYKTIKRRIFHYLTLFYLLHSSLLVLVNLYFWSNNFQLSTKSTLNMDYYIPQWTTENDLLSTSINTIPDRSPIVYWSKFDIEQNHIVHRTKPLNWTRSIFHPEIPLNIRLPSSSMFVIISILYHLIINYCFLSTFLILERPSLMIIVSIVSRFCLIVTRIYTFLFLFHLNAWWFAITFLIVHFSLMIILLLDREKLKDKQRKNFIQLIFSFLTHSLINDVSINALISLENISIFLHRLYLETFSSHNETTLRLIIFLAVLISLQIIGFLFDILSKNILYRTESTNQTITKL